MDIHANRSSQQEVSVGRSWRWPVRLLALIAILATFLLAAGIGYQVIASAADARNYPAPGTLVDVGGYHLHVNVMGEATAGSTVILENGGGGFSPQWGWVQPGVAQFAQVVAYDRPGTGWSEASPEPLDAVGAVEALRTALEQSGISGPYVLVGHSMGALMVRTFARLYPDKVAGVVLVDPRPVSWDTVFPEGGGEVNFTFFRLLGALNRLGIPRLAGAAESQAEGLPPRAFAEAVSLSYSNHHVSGMLPDGLVGESATQLLADGDDLGGRPLVVLSAGAADASFDAEVRPRLTAAQEAITSISSQSEHRLVVGATHYTIVTHQQHAEAVVEAIRDVVEISTMEQQE